MMPSKYTRGTGSTVAAQFVLLSMPAEEKKTLPFAPRHFHLVPSEAVSLAFFPL